MNPSPPSRVLMIEDNPQNAYLARYLLENAGFNVTIHTNAREGFAAATQDPPDVILLDIQLPDMDGYAVARQFRATAATATTPVIAVSSFAMPGEKAKALEAGCNGYIEKPIKALSFVEQVKNFMQAKEAR